MPKSKKARATVSDPSLIDYSKAVVFNQHSDRIEVNLRRSAINEDWGDTVLDGVNEWLTERLRGKVAGMPAIFDFSNNEIGDKFLRKFLDLLQRRHMIVSSLRFYDNLISDAGARHLAEFICWQESPLHELSLSHNFLTAVGVVRVLIAFGKHTGYPYATTLGYMRPVVVRFDENFVRCVAPLYMALKSCFAHLVKVTIFDNLDTIDQDLSSPVGVAGKRDAEPIIQVALHNFFFQQRGISANPTKDYRNAKVVLMGEEVTCHDEPPSRRGRRPQVSTSQNLQPTDADSEAYVEYPLVKNPVRLRNGTIGVEWVEWPFEGAIDPVIQRTHADPRCWPLNFDPFDPNISDAERLFVTRELTPYIPSSKEAPQNSCWTAPPEGANHRSLPMLPIDEVITSSSASGKLD